MKNKEGDIMGANKSFIHLCYAIFILLFILMPTKLYAQDKQNTQNQNETIVKRIENLENQIKKKLA